MVGRCSRTTLGFMRERQSAFFFLKAVALLILPSLIEHLVGPIQGTLEYVCACRRSLCGSCGCDRAGFSGGSYRGDNLAGRF